MSFYTPPPQLPGGSGEIVKTEAMEMPLTFPGPDGPLPAQAQRIMYTSTDRHGTPVPVTGAYLEPTTAWNGPGQRPLIVVAPGTEGQGDQCAPSNTLSKLVQYNGGLDAMVQYESIGSIYPLLATGAAVVLTDYQGLGTPGHHPYFARESSAHAVLDAARAAKSISDNGLEPDAPIGLWGASQGGGAAAAAAELASSYAPELPIVGTYAGTPVVDIEANLRYLDGGSLTGGVGYYINGAVEEVPALQAVVDREMNEAGKQMLTDTAGQCLAETLLAYGYRDSRQWTTSGRSLADVLATDPAFSAHLRQDRVGDLRPHAPVLVDSIDGDELVSNTSTRELVAEWCANGADVTDTHTHLINDPFRLGAAHVLNALESLPSALQWMSDRLAGAPNPSTC